MEKYLALLKKELYFFDSKEREKIIDRYKSIINQRGISKNNYKQIVKELGSIDENVRKICDEYNLDFNYCNRHNNLDKDVQNISKIIANFIRDIIKVIRKYSYSMNLESFLEVIIKVITLIFICSILKLPLIVLESFGNFVNKLLFYPFNITFDLVLSLILSLVYLLGCVFLFLKIFGTYKVKEKKDVIQKPLEVIDKEYNWLEFVIRFVAYLVILIPLIILGVIVLLSIIITLYLLILGISVVGLPIMLLGLFGLIISLFMIVKDSLNHSRHAYLLRMIVSIIIFMVGIGISIYNFSQFKYPGNLDNSSLDKTSEEKVIKLDDINTGLYLENGNYEVILDDDLNDDEVRIQVTYYDEYVDIYYHQEKVKDINYLVFKAVEDDNIKTTNIVNNIINDLKRGYIFNYSNVKNINLKIYANGVVKDNIEKNQ